MTELIKGKHLVGYHLPQKMADFGLLDSFKASDSTQIPVVWDKAFDIAKIFNPKGSSEQASMTSLCQKYLNLIYKKKRLSPPFAFTEAKISMALYKRWMELTS